VSQSPAVLKTDITVQKKQLADGSWIVQLVVVSGISQMLVNLPCEPARLIARELVKWADEAEKSIISPASA
jgi:hypothetical protein